MEDRQEPVSGTEQTVGGKEPLPAGPSPNPDVPGAAVALAQSPTFGDPEPPRRYADDRPDRDKPSKPRVVDLLSQAVGAELYGVNWNATGWEFPKTGERFMVSRFYVHPKVAVDFPGQRELERDVELKRQVLRGLGIVYIVVGPTESKTKDEIIAAIAAERKLLEGGE